MRSDTGEMMLGRNVGCRRKVQPGTVKIVGEGANSEAVIRADARRPNS